MLPTLLPTRPVAPVWSCLSHRYFKSCRPCEGRSCRWCRALSLSYPTVWGSSSALFAGKGCARLRREAWESKSPSQGVSQHRALPAIPNTLPVLLLHHTVPHTPARTEGARPPYQGHFTLDRCLPQLQRPPCSHGLPDPPHPTKPDQSRGSVSDQEGQRLFAGLVDSAKLDLERHLRICYSLLLCK